MKICEANEQTLGGAKSEPIKFSSLPLARSYSLHRPFTSCQPAALSVSAARDLAGVRLHIYMFPYRNAKKKKKIRDARKILGLPVSIVGTNAGGEIIRSRRTYTFRGLFAFQLADSCSEETLIGYQEAGKNNEIIVNQYAAWGTQLVFVKQSGRSTLGTVAFKTSNAYKFHRNTIPSSPEHLI